MRSSAWLALVAEEAYNHCLLYIFRRGSVVVKIFSHLDQVITILLVISCLYYQVTRSNKAFRSRNWYTLKFVQNYRKDPNKWIQFHELQAWKREIDRYVMKSIHSSILDAEAETIFFWIKVDVSILARLPRWIRKKIPRSPPTVVHGSCAKEAIVRSLRKNGGRLTNGETSLKNHGMEHLNWACQRIRSTTEIIFVWHIATTVFHHLESSPQQITIPIKNLHLKRKRWP
ncbi:hypothetical protein FCM35_KLT09679 [Carex littledalei]|uniref:Uncharacterized protein n=1 Tax=Carex littledalei TaxID=544730 RepID=A0A833R1U1_9POAL|nr:hypothetical protein FCM35_KLT09679 [Carex littledalei]